MQWMGINSLWHASMRKDVATSASPAKGPIGLCIMRTVSLLPIFFSFALSLHVSLFCLSSVAAGVRASLWLRPVWLHQRYQRRTDRQTGVSCCRQIDRGWESERIRKVRVNGWWREVKKEVMARQMRPILGESVLTNRGGAGFQVWLHRLIFCFGLTDHFNSPTPWTTNHRWLTITNQYSDSLILWSLSVSVII